MLRNWRSSSMCCLTALLPTLIGLTIGYYLATDQRPRGIYLDETTSQAIWFFVSGFLVIMAAIWLWGTNKKTGRDLLELCVWTLIGGALWGFGYLLILVMLLATAMTIQGMWEHWIVTIVLAVLATWFISAGNKAEKESTTATQS